MTARGRSTVGVVSSSMHGSLAQLALAQLLVPPPTAGAECGYLPTVRRGYCAVRAGGPPKTPHAARAAFVFLGCLVLTPARRLCAEVGARPSGRT